MRVTLRIHLVGAVGFVQATVVGNLADLAWVLGAHDQGRGLVTEAVMAVRDWLAESTVRRIEAHIHPRHEASQAVAQRIGMVRTGEGDDDDEEIWAADFDVTAHRTSNIEPVQPDNGVLC